MANHVQFTDNSARVKADLENKGISFLHEAKDSLASQAARNCNVDTGQLKRSFTTDSMVDENEMVAYIGSSLEYAIWQEKGTGEYALEGNGRVGGWVYTDRKTGKRVFTRGNQPRRMLYHAFQTKKQKIIQRAQQIYKG